MSKKFLWVDLEMTGLDEQVDVILEVAAIVTDLKFRNLAEMREVVHQTQETLDKMDEWCTKTHGESGLSAAVPHGKPLQEVEDQLLDLIDQHFAKDEKIVLCGNSIGQDRKFIEKYMRAFADRLHYRIVDVSSFKEIFREKYGCKFDKQNTHRALDDIQESIRELVFYLSFIDEKKMGRNEQ